MTFNHTKLIMSITNYEKLIIRGREFNNMVSKSNVSKSETCNKIWTKSAEDCYAIGCMCSKCSLFKFFFSKRKYKCKMKDTVLELVRLIGVPKNCKNDI